MQKPLHAAAAIGETPCSIRKILIPPCQSSTSTRYPDSHTSAHAAVISLSGTRCSSSSSTTATLGPAARRFLPRCRLDDASSELRFRLDNCSSRCHVRRLLAHARSVCCLLPRAIVGLAETDPQSVAGKWAYDFYFFVVVLRSGIRHASCLSSSESPHRTIVRPASAWIRVCRVDGKGASLLERTAFLVVCLGGAAGLDCHVNESRLVEIRSASQVANE
jgi:hypothetical protein